MYPPRLAKFVAMSSTRSRRPLSDGQAKHGEIGSPVIELPGSAARHDSMRPRQRQQRQNRAPQSARRGSAASRARRCREADRDVFRDRLRRGGLGQQVGMRDDEALQPPPANSASGRGRALGSRAGGDFAVASANSLLSGKNALQLDVQRRGRQTKLLRRLRPLRRKRGMEESKGPARQAPSCGWVCSCSAPTARSRPHRTHAGWLPSRSCRRRFGRAGPETSAAS